RSTMARAVAESQEAQRFVSETRKVARALKNEYAAELEIETPVPANLINIRDDPWFWSIARPLAIAAMIAICALVASLAVVSLKRPHFQSEQGIVVTGTIFRRRRRRLDGIRSSLKWKVRWNLHQELRQRRLRAHLRQAALF